MKHDDDLLSKSSTVDFWDDTCRFAEGQGGSSACGTEHARADRTGWRWAQGDRRRL